MARDEAFTRTEEIGEALFSILNLFSWYKERFKTVFKRTMGESRPRRYLALIRRQYPGLAGQLYTGREIS